jgi:2-amino-4-hydroxy-6-hydroxymethyldihydropteridine diphosphokinase
MDVFLGVGSNIRPETNVPAALELLQATPALEVLAVSPFYRTPALGSLGGDAEFVNGVFAIAAGLEPRPLKFEVLRPIEARLGRSPSRRTGARTIDLDIVAYGHRVVDAPDLLLPDPDWLTRAFIAVPLAELSPAFVHPVTGTTAASIAAALDAGALRPDPEITARLRGLLDHPPAAHGGGHEKQ